MIDANEWLWLHSLASPTELREYVSCCFDSEIGSWGHGSTSRISTGLTNSEHILVEDRITERLSHLGSGIAEIMDITGRSEIILNRTWTTIYSTEPCIYWTLTRIERTLGSDGFDEISTRSAGQFGPVPAGSYSEGRASWTSEDLVRTVLKGEHY